MNLKILIIGIVILSIFGGLLAYEVGIVTPNLRTEWEKTQKDLDYYHQLLNTNDTDWHQTIAKGLYISEKLIDITLKQSDLENAFNRVSMIEMIAVIGLIGGVAVIVVGIIIKIPPNKNKPNQT